MHTSPHRAATALALTHAVLGWLRLLQLTSTEDLWSIDQAGDLHSGSFSFGSGETVTDEDVPAYLMSHANQQQHEAQDYQQELTRRRAKARGRRGKKGPMKLLGTRSVSHDSVRRLSRELSCQDHQNHPGHRRGRAARAEQLGGEDRLLGL